jgi:Ser/Thr protein kinase RdoA (MazF antagonist)
MPAVPADTPYADLDHAAVLGAVESLGLACDGRVLALNSYENRVFRVGMEDAAPLVAKFYRPGRWSEAAIGEEHDFALELADAGLSVVAPLRVDGLTLHRHGRQRFALFPLQGGHAPEPGDRDVLRRLGQSLGQLHNIGARRRFEHRPNLDLDTFGEAPVNFLLDHGWLPAELEDNFAGLADALFEHLDALWLHTAGLEVLRLHGDCHPGNLLWRDDRAHFVDLDDCLSGPAVQDLWMLLSGPADEQSQQLGWLLEGYEIYRAFDRRELALVEALRTLRLLHFNAWIARRWHDPAFPAAFPWFGERRHWERTITQLQEQLAALQEPCALAP